CSAALEVDGQCNERFVVAPREHGRVLLPMIHSLMAEADIAFTSLDAIVFGRGPGAFTGVRIAVATAQGLALGADVALVGVSTLATLAQGAAQRRSPQAVFAAIDARMGEVYTGAFDRPGSDGAVVSITEETVC